MSKITREEALEVLQAIVKCPNGFDGDYYDKLWNIVIQQTTPKELEEGYWYCPNCKEELCNENVTYQELHDTCGYPAKWVEPLTSTPQLSDSVEEVLQKIGGYAINDEWSVGMTDEFEELEQHIQALTKENKAQASEIEELKGIIIQQSDSRNELTNKLNDIKAWFEINLLEDEYVSILKGDNNEENNNNE